MLLPIVNLKMNRISMVQVSDTTMVKSGQMLVNKKCSY